MARKRKVAPSKVQELSEIVTPTPEWLTKLIDTPMKIPANDEFPFAGYFPEEGKMIVFLSPDQIDNMATGWYWWDAAKDGNEIVHGINFVGPFPTDEGAYLAAIGD